MEIDIKKVYGKTPENGYEASEQLVKANADIINALYIMQSTIENWDDKECLEINKDRMIKYFNKFSK